MPKGPILVTGAAGFIGFHLSKRLLDDGYEVVGIDNLNDYYSVRLKQDRLAQLNKYRSFDFHRVDLADKAQLAPLFEQHFDGIVNLAAQAGVRYSLENPQAYVQANLVGFVNLLEQAKLQECRNFLFASSSSVYGANTTLPFSVEDNVDHPVSLYAATKKANELIAHSFSVNFGLPVTGLRFFTVYGPWGRPDMALFLFTKAMLKGEPINVFNHGDMERDFTYVGDVVEGIVRLIKKPASSDSSWSSDSPNPSSSFAPYRIYNIGNNSPVKLMDFIHALEEELGIKAELNLMPIQKGDVPSTYADVSHLIEDVDYQPKTTVKEGIHEFVKWYKAYFNA